MDPKLNQQAIAEGNARITALDAIIADPSASPAAKRDATAARKGLQQEVSLRRKVEGAKTPAAKKKAEQSLAAFRAKNCPTAEDGRTIAKCRPTLLFVHLHMRFLLPPALLCDMRDVSKYPRRAANVSEATFKSRFSFAGQTIPAKKRWSGDHPVVGATVTLDGKEASTDKLGIARFENVGAGGDVHRIAQTIELPNDLVSLRWSLGVALTFFGVCIGWLLFRATSITQAWGYARVWLAGALATQPSGVAATSSAARGSSPRSVASSSRRGSPAIRARRIARRR